MIKLLRMGLVLARVVRGQTLGISPTERLKLRQRAVGFSFAVQEVHSLEVVEELSTLATLFGAEGVCVWMNGGGRRAAEGLEKADLLRYIRGNR